MSYQFYITPTNFEVAEQNGINAQTLIVRVRKLAWHIEPATTKPLQDHNKWTKWIEIARKNGITSQTFYGRIRRGISPEKASKEPVMSEVSKMAMLAEKRRKYPKELYELAQKNGIKKDTFCKRMSRGWSAERAANEPLVREKRYGNNDFLFAKKVEGAKI